MSVKNEEMQAQVPYEDHIIPSTDGGAQGLSGYFDMAAEITKEAVGLAKEIGSNIAELGHELDEMMNTDLVPEESLPNEEWLETEWGIMMERRAQMRDRDHDMGR
jgi:hypothetical protein